MAVMSAGGPLSATGSILFRFESSPGSTEKPGSIKVDPKKIVFVRIAKKRVISPRWKASQALELLKPHRH